MQNRSTLAGIAALLFGAGLSVGAMPSAQAQMLNDRQSVMDISVGGLQAFLDEAGWRYEPKIVSGETVLVTEIEGKTVILWPRACNANGVCAGLLSFAVIGDLANTDDVNSFNNRFHAARASLRDGRVVLDTYTYADFGVVRGSLLIELAVLAGLVDDWWKFTDSDRPQGARRPDPKVQISVSSTAPTFPFAGAVLDQMVGLNTHPTGSSQPHLSSVRPSNSPKK